MTNHWNDIAFSDCILIMGSNAAENHPISFKYVTKAMDNGAKLISVDPRFTRTSARADLYAGLRSGTDVAVLGGMIKYILDNDKFFKEYVLDNTNASFIVSKNFAFENGVFSGFDESSATYDKSNWDFEKDSNGIPKRDETLTHPRCVLQLLKKHYERYTVDKVVDISGIEEDKLLELYELFSATGKRGKAGTIMYAMGWTQHTVGVQNIRTMAIIQLLLGNVGIAGGGVNALRGECNVQGSTDHALLYHILPGYLKTPKVGQDTLEAYNKAYTPVSADPKSANWWSNYPKYSASLFKAMWLEDDPKESYTWMPKLDNGSASKYSWIPMVDHMAKGGFEGLFTWGMNPACSSPDANKVRQGLGELKWMVNVNIFPNETADFWNGPGMDPETIDTEVFFLPCASPIEKEGSISNSGRWMQWRYKGPEPLDGLISDGHMFHELMEELQHLYAKEDGVFPKPIERLSIHEWGSHTFEARQMAKLVNGWFTKDTTVKGKKFKKGDQVPSFAYLQDDGSTCSGNWLYCNSYTEEGNKSQRRSLEMTPEQEKIQLYSNFSWCWPVNRRILYNRASVDKQGRPFNPDKAVISWDPIRKKWLGDVPDGGWAPGSKHSFIMRKHGVGQLFGPGRVDGPLPEYYEPLESPVKSHPFSKQFNNPTAISVDKEKLSHADPKFPFVATTYRVTEHWQTGSITRWLPWTLETEPQVFVEMSEELAAEKGFENGEKITIESPRGAIWAVAIVTKRLRPFTVQGKTVHQVGLPWHYGWLKPNDGGDSANLLTPSAGDPNTGIPEYKAFMVNVRKWKDGDA